MTHSDSNKAARSSLGTTGTPPPSDLDLHAFLDNELTPNERLRVLEWLIATPEKAQEFLEIQRREELLRAAANDLMSQETPQRLVDALKTDEVFADIDRRSFLYGLGVGLVITVIVAVITIAA